MKLRNALVAAGMLVLPAAAMAQPVDGLYVGAGAGYNWMQNQNVKAFDGAPTPSNTNLHTNGGVVALGSVGYGFGNGFRVEIEGDYRNLHQRAQVSGSDIGVGDFAQTYGAMVNGLYDFDVGAGMVFPYVGVGVGYQWTTGRTGSFSDTEGSPAGQAILGVSFPIPDFAGLSVTAEYRFMATFENETFSSGGLSAKVANQYNHAGLIGLRYAFGVTPAAVVVPPPAPVAVPTPPPARTYLVFFDWDKYDLTARARQIIAEAAANVPKVQVTRIEVNGYTDTSGTPAYNQGLSVRRADAVKAELVRDGVPANEIFTQGFGETHLLVPTGPGVREPQNRRVEIILK